MGSVHNQLVYICGSGHSGSTLLDMLLGGHERISALGEIHRFYLSMNRASTIHRCCCGKAVGECSFWSAVLDEWQSLLGLGDREDLKEIITTDPTYLEATDEGMYLKIPKKHRRYPYNISVNRAAMVLGSGLLWRLSALVDSEVRMHRTIIRNSLMLYEAVRRAWNTPIIVDSTKNPNRLKGLYMDCKDRFKVIYLIRDGRAVCFSRMRREGLPMDRCARVWKMEHQKQWLTQLTIPKDLILRVHYEDLCRNPEEELSRICGFLGVEYQPSMLDFRVDRHNLGGNPMRFRSEETGIFLDERWRHQMEQTDCDTFRRIAGNLNRQLGYRDQC